MPPPDFTHHAEMGFSHRELLAALPAAIAPFALTESAPGDAAAGVDAGTRTYHLQRDGQRIRLVLHAETTRALAALRLPLTVVQLHFFGFTRAEFDAFMRRFHRHLQKGGG